MLSICIFITTPLLLFHVKYTEILNLVQEFKKIITKHKITNNPLNVKIEHELFYEKNTNTKTYKTSILTKELKELNYD